MDGAAPCRRHLLIEVIANPLNLGNQQRATGHGADPGVARIGAAPLRSAVRARGRRGEANGKSQDVDGVTLSDEGLAGARVDAESHVTIDVEFNQPAYSFTVASSIAPSASRTVTVAGAVAVITVPSNVYRQKTAASTDDRFCPAETVVFFGAVHAPDVSRALQQRFTVTAAGTTPKTCSGALSGGPTAWQRDADRANPSRIRLDAMLELLK